MWHNKYITSPKFFCTLYLIYFFCLQTNPQMTTKNGIIYMSSPLKFSDFVSFGFLLSLVNKPPKLLQKMVLLYIISLSLKSWHSFCLWFSSFAHKQNPKILQAWHSKNVYNLFGPHTRHFFSGLFVGGHLVQSAYLVKWIDGGERAQDENRRWERSGTSPGRSITTKRIPVPHLKWNQESDFRSGS